MTKRHKKKKQQNCNQSCCHVYSEFGGKNRAHVHLPVGVRTGTETTIIWFLEAKWTLRLWCVV